MGVIRIDAQAPLALYGKAVRFLGVEVCYNARNAASLFAVMVDVPVHVDGGIGSENHQVIDSTTRIDDACRVYSDPTPIVLTADHSVGVQVQVSWLSVPADFHLGRATFIFEPTSTLAAPVQ